MPTPLFATPPAPPIPKPHAAPTRPASPAPINPPLHVMLRLCREKWVCDFLFNTDPAHLTILTAPLLTQHAQTCTVSISRFEPTAPRTSPPLQHLDAAFVFVPAFSVAHISAGFGMQENTFTSRAPTTPVPKQPSRAPNLHLPAPLPKEQFRYVRDDLAGAILMLYDFPASDHVRIEYISHQSSTSRLRSFAQFNRTALLASLRADAGVLLPETVFPAITLFQSVYEYRNCPTCARPHGELCGCRLDLVAPRHSLDFRNGVKHMASHVGAFEGTANLNLFENGAALKHVSLASRMLVQSGSVPDLVQRLTKWAVTEHLKELPPDPMTSLLPAPPLEDPSLGAEVLTGEDLDFLSFDSGPSSSSQPSAEIPVSGHFADAAMQFSNDDSPEMMTSEDWDNNDFSSALLGCALDSEEYPMQKPPESQGQDYFGLNQNSKAFRNSIPETYMSIDQVLGMPQALDPSTQVGGKVHFEPLGVPFPDTAGQDEQPDCVPSASNSYSTKDENNPLSAKEEPERVVPTGNEHDEIARMKELKRQLKRERNRASAKRSNTKKKHENDARKRERQRLLDLETRLRAEEQRLRSENLQLRRQLYGANAVRI